MLWHHYAFLFYWAVSGFWLFLEAADTPRMDYLTACLFGFAFGWLALPSILIGRALR